MNIDVLAHMMFAPVLFTAAGLLIYEYKGKIKYNVADGYYGLIAFVAGVLYFWLLNGHTLLINNISTNDSITNQHLLISVSLMLFGLILIFFDRLKKLPTILIGILLLVLSYIFYTHNHPEGVAHADWLNPYHKAISALLLLSTITFVTARFTKYKKLLIATAILFSILGVQLLFYRDPNESKPLPVCANVGKTIEATIDNDSFSSQSYTANRCDVLKIKSTGGEHIIAFGEHEHHDHYPGYRESLVTKSRDLEINLIESGNFLVHDHENDDIFMNIKINN